MRYRQAVVIVCFFALVGCLTPPGENSIYQSSAPELRGERAIASDIVLVREVELGSYVLGVFFSREVFQAGDSQTLLFIIRSKRLMNGQSPGSIVNYDMGLTGSLSVDQGRKFLKAIEQYLAKDPKSLQPSQMYNFELYSGTVDMSAGTDRYRPFKRITFAGFCTVTSTGKSFKMMFPGIGVGLGGVSVTFQTFELAPDEVQMLRGAIQEALAKAAPTVPGMPDIPSS
jgi:hypothetical protein